jgi:cytochrome P450
MDDTLNNAKLPEVRSCELMPVSGGADRDFSNIVHERRRRVQKADMHALVSASLGLLAPTVAITLPSFLATRFAGHDTTAGTITIALHFLGQSPKWQHLIRKEVIDACGAIQPISLEQLENLPALNACVKETLRLYPAAPNGGKYKANSVRC